MQHSVVLFILSISVASGFLLETSNRNVTKILKVTNAGRYGYWSNPQFCPPGTFASGFSMKIESNQFTGDDTALNAIRLTCSDDSGHAQLGYQITSGEGPFGSWSKTETCNQQFHASNFLVGFALQVEAPQGAGDDTSANYVKFFCRDFDGNNAETELNRPPGHGNFGNWGEWSDSCDKDSAICGLNTKVESQQGGGDDTGLNDAIFYCCNDDSGSGFPVGK
ncbi:vitelline membrane outer layer protein 1-like [Mercenaria mercenaria]|uniref:vitelline membrane outer layer protein 1-like n=1 Tax=Mercenaria mercenaria TaxID=6596 RepID=UPI001E1D3A2C|nr:vitelline membrane outer layer protein 1-like [Mercenaria mercenaria]